ncbi:MAG: glycosyltransferase family 4 protein [Actinomycetota bacterium]|nr:glycosyltransferase family 4 protein [Actinomycetota bacterium]
MKIATISTALPEPGRKPGGSDVLLERVARRLVAGGHDVCVFSYSPAPSDAPYRHVAMQPSFLAQGKARRLTLAPLALNRLDLNGFDVCHLHGDDWFFVRRGLPTVRTFYGSSIYEALHASRMRRCLSQAAVFPLEILSSRLATRTYSLVPGGADARWYRTSGALECGQDPDPAAASAAKHPTPTILFVGGWDGRKRGRLLAETFSRVVRAEIPDAELWMVSERVEPADGIVWFPTPTDDELADLYRRAWTFCLPSSYEGFGIPYLEAMAHQTAVVATPNLGARFILEEGRAGLICQPEQLGAGLVSVLRDPGRRQRLEDAGLARLNHFAWERILDLHEQAYELAIEDWRQRRRT